MRVLTTDVFAGAWLMSRGGRLVEVLVDRSAARDTGTFVIEGPTALADLETYSRGEALATVKTLRDHVTKLRGRLARALRSTSESSVTRGGR